ncbi:unnamed protein product [Prunus brigantina]
MMLMSSEICPLTLMKLIYILECLFLWSLLVILGLKSKGIFMLGLKSLLFILELKILLLMMHLILDDDVLLSSLASKKRKEGETSSKYGKKVKSKSIRAMLMDEDDEIDKDPSTFDSGKYPFHIDTVDQYDSDASLNDISVEEWDE